MSNSHLEYVNDYIEKYLENRFYKAAQSAFNAEKSKANQLKTYLEKQLIAEIRHSDILSLLNRLQPIYANKTINEYLIILRATFKLAERDGILSRNPMDGIENYKVTPPKPDPFQKNELRQLYQTEMDCISGKNACKLNILTGLRIGELIALAWNDVHWEKQELHIRRAKVLSQYKMPKTKESIRVVELNDLAIKILKNQFELTGKKAAKTVSVLQSDNKTKENQTLSFVFYNSKTKRPFLHAAQFNKDFFTPWLKKAGIKHRGVGQLRHTFASQSLTAGISKEWIAQQMGHTSTKMIDLHYGDWIKADAPDCAHALGHHLHEVFPEADQLSNPVMVGSVIPQSPPVVAVPPELRFLVQMLANRPELVSLLTGFAKGLS